jgi:hypothetical protein
MTPAAVDLAPIAPAVGPYLLAGGVLFGAGALLRRDVATPALARTWRRWRERAERLHWTRGGTPAAQGNTTMAEPLAPRPSDQAATTAAGPPATPLGEPAATEPVSPARLTAANGASESQFAYDRVPASASEPDRDAPPRFLSDDALGRFADIEHRSSDHATAVARAEAELAHLDRSQWHVARQFGSTAHCGGH